MPAERTLTTRLKDDNWKLHQIAERAEGPAGLIKGTLPRDGYINMLGQQWFMNSALDRAFGDHILSNEVIAAFVSKDQFLTPFIEEDLTHFGICPIHQTIAPGTQRFMDDIEAKKNDGLHLLGLHYVRLGACNGNRFVAKAVRKAYDLPETGEGTRYLDPFGESQREDWWAFKAALDKAVLTDSEADRVFEGTRAAYLHAICHGLDRQYTSEELFAKHEAALDRKAFDDGHSVHVGAGN
ncbi:MAG: biliverdin-producing heme oxygenase [Phycisphaerales bacterium]